MRDIRLIVGAVLLASLNATGASPDDIAGVWLSADGEGWIEIQLTVDGPIGLIAGSPDDPDRLKPPRKDALNPDPALTSRPLLGMVIMQGFSHVGGGKWKGGRIYDPNSGKTYKCRLTLIDQDTLHVRGYLGVSFLGRTEIWTRKQ